MRFALFAAAWGLAGSLALLYIVCGSIADFAIRMLEARKRRILETLSVLLFESDHEAAEVHDVVRRLPKRTLLSVIQSLAVDLEGQAHERLQLLTRSSGLEKFIVRRSTSRRWRERVQAAQLQYLITDPNFDRSKLLKDKHTVVRARAVESLGTGQAEDFLVELLDLLGDESIAVRLAAEQKILDIGSPAVPALKQHLRTNRRHLIEVLELAANLADHRLIETLDEHAASPDREMRQLTARALGHGVVRQVSPILRRLLTDEDELVRAEALTSLGRLEDVTVVTAVGRCLSDGSWLVRRAAGVALDRMGSAGRLILRQHLQDNDPFARDMARQMLDAGAAQRGLPPPPPIKDPLAQIELAS